MTTDNMPPLPLDLATLDGRRLGLIWHYAHAYARAYAEQQTAELSKAYEDLGASVMNLSHPNCKLLLADKRKAEQQTAELRAERDELLQQNFALRLDVARLKKRPDLPNFEPF